MDDSDPADDAPVRPAGMSPVRTAATVGVCLALVLGANVAIVAVPGEGGQSVIAPAPP